MSQFHATVQEIHSQASLHLVTCAFEKMFLTIVSLELPPAIQIGTKVVLRVKATQVTIGTNSLENISCPNQINATIQKIQRGQILTTMILKTPQGTLFESVILETSAQKLGLHAHQSITAFIEASALSIEEAL